MINTVSIAKRSLAGLLLIGSTGVCKAAVNNKQADLNVKQQAAELVSKAAADTLKSNTFKMYVDSVEFLPDGTILVYDSIGRVKKEYELNDKKGIESYYTYEYDDQNRSTIDTKFKPNNKVEWIKAYHYNKDGSRQEVTLYDDEKITWVCEYDSDDNLMKASIYDFNGKLDLRYVYSTDENGNRIETIYDADGNIVND